MIFLISDHAGFDLKQSIFETGILSELSEPVVDLNPIINEDDDYPDSALILAKEILHYPTWSYGIAICGSGQGICMALNRFEGIRAGVAYNTDQAKLLREHNDANVICLAGRSISFEESISIISAFVSTSASQEERHVRRRQKLDKISHYRDYPDTIGAIV